MKWPSLDYIKAHSRIDYDCEDELLQLYADSARETILNICDRKETELLDEDGNVPVPLLQAALMLVDNSYQQRSPVTAQNLYTVPYTFDLLVKPYMKL